MITIGRKKSTSKQKPKKSIKLRIKEKLIRKNQKADIVSCDPKKETVKIKVEETVQNAKTGEIYQKRNRTRSYSLSTKSGLSPKREDNKSKRLKKKKEEKLIKSEDKRKSKTKRLKERAYRKKIEERDKKRPKYYEFKTEANSYKGTGKTWIQKIEDGKRTDFVDPHNVDKPMRHYTEKTWRLKPGEYLVNETGTKSQDSRYKLRINKDGTTEKFK